MFKTVFITVDLKNYKSNHWLKISMIFTDKLYLSGICEGIWFLKDIFFKDFLKFLGFKKEFSEIIGIR